MAVSFKPPKGLEGLCGRDAIWSAIRHLREFEWLELHDLTGLDESVIKCYLRDLRKGGFIDYSMPPKRYQKTRWTLVRDIGVERPIVNKKGQPGQSTTGRDQIWRTLKVINHDFDKHQLKTLASTDEHVISIREVKFYLLYLCRAGYVHQVQKASGRQAAVYRAIKSRIVGPKAPKILTTHQVFDPNKKAIVWTEAFEETE